MKSKRNKGNNELRGIIIELQGMMLRNAPQGPVEAAREKQRLNEIEAILSAKEAQLPPHLQRMLNGIEGKQ